MSDRHPTMMEPPVEDLLDRVDSKFTLVSLAALRGRQINSYFNQLGEGLGSIVPPQVTSVSRKPLSISLEEIAAGKITYVRPPDSEAEAHDTPVEMASPAAANADVETEAQAEAEDDQ
jgi:DNA-directed RNA polymerase subunit omega